jgi:Prokaryotic Cytochrome C oxidase subunit IV
MKPQGYVVMLLALLGFSLAEFGATFLPVSRGAVLLALLLLVLAQTAYFVLVSMHLKDETWAMRRVVALPLVIGAVYGLVLVSESGWRHL